MKFLPLIFRNALRNRRRTILTVLSISMSLFLISTLWTLLQQLESPPLTPDSATRIITRHQTSLANTMPISYREKIRTIPGVEEVSAYQWFGGVYKDPANFFAQFAVDPEHYFTVYPDIHVVSPDQMDAFKKERSAALVGVNLAKRYGWNIGDRVTLQGTFFPTIELIIRGFLKDAGSESLFIFRYDYLNEVVKGSAFADRAGTFAVKVKSADDIAAVAEAIDATFLNSTAPTKTETEKAFVLGFVSMLGNVRTLVVSISTVLIFTIILVTANTMAMSIRERTGEIAILKTLGFSPIQVLSVLIGESAFIAVLGGLLGSLGARYILGAMDFATYTTGFIQVFDVKWATVLLAAGISLVVAFMSTFVPAWSASQLTIADAVRRRGE
jgi:putative ABC transport system permease protein